MAEMGMRVQDLAEIINEQHRRFYLGDTSMMSDVWDQDEYEDADASKKWLYKAKEAKELFYGLSITALRQL